MFYLANDDRPDRPRRFCWECGSDETPRADSKCQSCGADLAPRRFLVSVRWDAAGFKPFTEFFEKRLEHKGVLFPVDMFFQDNVLCSVTPWTGEGLLLDEGSPLAPERVVDLAQRGAGMLAFLHHNGVTLNRLTRANFLVRNGTELLLFDLDIQKVTEGPVPEAARSREVTWLGAVLRRFTPASATDLQEVFSQAEEGTFSSPLEFGRALEALFERDHGLGNPEVGAMSDVGLCRVLNEDNWGWIHLRDDIQLHVVADGMGGHEAGEVASEMAVETICREAQGRLTRLTHVTPHSLENVLEESFRQANNGIKDHSERMGSDMGTTMVATLLAGPRLAYVANVGDSRGYLMREGVLHQVTRDHSLVARMVEQNRITREEARNHPHSNILLRTVGTERDVDIDIFSVELEKNDRLLMCSDGLWGEVDDEDIEAILNHYEDPRVACRELIRAAHHGGGRDNITVIILNIAH